MNRRIPADVLPIEAEFPAFGFAGFEFDPVRAELKGPDGVPRPLRPKAELLLRQFLTHPGRLLAREELMDVLWPSAVVTDDSLVQCVGELRAVLDDRGQSLIRTVPRRGYRFDAEVTRGVPELTDLRPQASATRPPTAAEQGAGEPAPVRSRRRLGVTLAAATLVAVAVAVAALATWRWLAPTAPRIDDEIATRHVVAVMPLRVADTSSSTLRELADRLGDQIAVQLAVRPGTRSIGRARTALLGDAPLTQIAGTLHATYVLTGFLSRAPGGATTVELQLVAAPDGAVLGAERFALPASPDDEALSGVGQEVMNFVRGRAGEVDDARATRPGHVPDAADLTLLAWNDVNRRRGPELAASARARFAEALRQDPSSIIALQGLGAAHLQQRTPDTQLTPAQIAEGERAIERVVRLSPDDATAAILWGNLQILKGRPDLAIPSFEKSNRLLPGYTNGHLMLGRALLSVGRTTEVQAEVERAVRLASLMHDTSRTSAAWTLAAEAALMQHDDARALEFARRAVAEYPMSREGHAVLAAVEALSGMPQEAAAEMATYRRAAPRATIADYDNYRPSANPAYVAERGRLYEGLRLAGLPEH